MLPNVRNCKLPALLMSVVLLTGCGSTSINRIPATCPEIPPPPAMSMTPVQQESYLERAQRNIETWLKTLTDSKIK